MKVDYSKLSQKQLSDLLDKAIDRGWVRVIQEVSKYLK
jgi:hypothetical protein